ncbi:hypothetical protein BDP27DRAFT_1328754 [Rhodocollybia butyracea]|uniref:Uncharacterized protein n=1 Tax=Rhodocollybia butyracea TaxID=206335 RepID=A0A9P5PSZ0_9AGAR|nr:hypothetical protein BDP27DRAFT_1328754 [Rhodocollybia butyracea]
MKAAILLRKTASIPYFNALFRVTVDLQNNQEDWFTRKDLQVKTRRDGGEQSLDFR